jgi:hypothetical protein
MAARFHLLREHKLKRDQFDICKKIEQVQVILTHYELIKRSIISHSLFWYDSNSNKVG